MQIRFTGPRGEKGDDGEPGISAKSVERIKFECKPLLFSIYFFQQLFLYYFYFYEMPNAMFSIFKIKLSNYFLYHI